MFQSSSSPKTGCKLIDALGQSGATGFNPHPARRPDASRCFQNVRSAIKVSILIQPEDRMQVQGNGLMVFGIVVSILIQPEDRMQVDLSEQVLVSSLFQSSSSPKTGCKGFSNAELQFLEACFNPHPARRPDASIVQPADVGRLDHVSILIQPEDRMQEYQSVDQPGPQAVSILIQPEDRMQGRYQVFIAPAKFVFQSSSSPKTGCKRRWPPVRSCGRPVSILIQPEDRMQAPMATGALMWTSGFNPHPARRPDASSRTAGLLGGLACFNPHPARRPDARARQTLER